MSSVPVRRLALFYALYFGVIAIMIAWQAPYFTSLGLSPAEIGWVLGMAGALKVISPMLWGWIGDHMQQRIWIVRLGAILCVASILWLPSVTTFWALALVLCVFSFFWDAILSQFDAVTFEHLGDNGRVWYPRIRGLGSAGFVIAAVVSGYWFEFNPITHWPYVMAALVVVLAVISVSVPGRAVHAEDAAPTQGFGRVVLAPAVLSFLIAAFLIKTSTAPLNVFFTLFAMENGHSQWVAGSLWALGVVIEVVILVFNSQRLARFAPQRLMLVALAVAMLRWPLIAWGIESLPLMIFASILHGITFGVFHAGAMEFLRQQFPRRQLGRGIALYSTLGFGLANMVGAPISGYLYESGGGELAFMVAAMVATVGFIVLYWQLNRAPQESPAH
ncbi:MAG: MFS transporter [Litorivicinus sp.]